MKTWVYALKCDTSCQLEYRIRSIRDASLKGAYNHLYQIEGSDSLLTDLLTSGAQHNQFKNVPYLFGLFKNLFEMHDRLILL